MPRKSPFLTIGEVARVLAAEEGAAVEVIETDAPDGWQAGREWVPSSPNLPDLLHLRLYPGACLIEALDASEGRGTALPFRQFGAPGLNAYALTERLNALNIGVTARPAFFNPTTSKHQGERCAGVQLHETGGSLRRGRFRGAAHQSFCAASRYTHPPHSSLDQSPGPTRDSATARGIKPCADAA